MDHPGLDMHLTTARFPMQFEGMIQGWPAYFRARHGHWSFSVAKTLDDAIGGGELSLYECTGTFGDEFSGEIDPEMALDLMQACLHIWSDDLEELPHD